MKANNMIVGFILLALPQMAFSAETKTADIFEMKSRLEAVVSKKFRKSLETRLNPEDFNVTVNLAMTREEKPAPPPPKPAEDPVKKILQQDEESQFLPSLPGYVSANTIMNIYEAELEKERERREGATAAATPAVAAPYNYIDDLKNYKITGAVVSVGLNREFDADYKTKLKNWLSTRIKQEFGTNSTAEVDTIAAKPKEEVKEPTFLERIDKLLWPIVVTVFALLALAGICIYQVFKARVRAAELKNRVNIKKMEMDNAREREEERKQMLSQETEAEKLKRLRLEYEAKMFETQKRINSALKNFPDQMSAISTLVTYEDGGRKIAALLDSAFAIEGKNADVYQIPDTFFKLDIPDAQRREIQKSFVSYQSLNIEEKVKVLESTFWSLATIGVTNDYQDKKPFQYLRRLPSSSISNALKNTRPEEQLVAVLHLPEEYQRAYMAGLTEDTKVEMIENTFRKEKVSYEELQNVNQVIHHTFKRVESEFGMVEGAIELLKSIRARDEVKIVMKLGQVNPVAYENVRGVYLSLGFIETWNDVAIKTLVDSLEVSDLTALVKTFGSIKERVVAGLTEMVSTILQDDLMMQESTNQVAIDASLDRIRTRLRELESQGVITIENAYNQSSQPDSLRLAS